MSLPHKRDEFYVPNISACCAFIYERTGVHLGEVHTSAICDSEADDEKYLMLETTVFGEVQGFMIPFETAKKNKLFETYLFRKVE